IVVRKIGVVFMAIEGELENSGSRQVKLVAQGHDVRRNHAQIFGDKRQVAQLSLHSLEKAGTGTLDPLAGLSRWCTDWDVPRGCKSAEVIQADRVHMGQQGPQPIYTPPITG